MKWFVTLWSILLLLTLSRAAMAQSSDRYTLFGKVIDALTEENLSGVKVVLLGTSKGAVTDRKGRFLIAELDSGAYTLQTTLTGYQPFTQELIIGTSLSDTLIIALKEKVPEASEIEVSAETIDNPSTYALNPKRLAMTAGALEDLHRALYTLPGVMPNNDLYSQLVIRGGGADQNLIVLENVEIFNPYRIFGGVSIFNPMTLGSLNLYVGGFPVRYGDRLSAVLEANFREGTRSSLFSLSANVSLLDANLVAEGWIPSLNGSWWVSARRTYLDLIIGPLINLSVVPNFTEGQFKVVARPTGEHQVEFAAYIARDGFVERRSTVPRTQVGQVAGSGSVGALDYLAALTWKYTPSPTLSLMSVLSRYQNGSTANLSQDAVSTLNPFTTRPVLEYDQNSLLQKWTLTQRLYLSAGAHQLEAGATLDWLDTEFRYTRRDFNVRDSIRVAQRQLQYGSSRPPALDAALRFGRISAFIQDRFQPTRTFFIESGLRWDFYQLLQKSYFSPRVSARLEVISGTSLNAALGIFYQSPGIEKWIDQNPGLLRLDFDDPTNVLDLSDRNAVSRLNAERAVHYIFGIEQEFGTEWQLKVEGYYKLLTDIIVQTQQRSVVAQAELRSGQNPLLAASYTVVQVERTLLLPTPVNAAVGNIYGVEVMLEKKLTSPSDKFNGWISYAFTRSERTQYGQTVPFAFDRPHSVNVTLNFRPSREWEFGLTWRFASGQPYTPAQQTRPIIAFIDGQWQVLRTQNGTAIFLPDFGDGTRINSARMPDYHRLDARLTYMRKWGDVNWQLYLDIMNVYNRQNVLGITQSARGTEIAVTEQLALPLIPTVGFNIAF
ncbi:MAG: TonB-dependent receptor [Candidatus Thermochlorobacter sp.]